MIYLTNCGQNSSGIVKWASKLPGHSSFIWFIQKDNFLKQIEISLKTMMNDKNRITFEMY